MEVLVFEHPDCTYCRIFRRDVLPRYREAMPADTVPLRFVDIATNDTGSLGLKRRIDMVPTAVLMRDGHEVDRIAGYWGPDNFFKLLTHMLGRME
jgi:thioredoxin-related protein